MKVAVITDIHGNREALEAFFQAAERDRPDRILCLGDVGDPLADSQWVWEELKRRKIPCLRGNHEDYTVRFHADADRAKWWRADFRSVACVAERFGPAVAAEFATLPLEMSLVGEGAGEIHLSHASPLSSSQSYYDVWTPELRAELAARPVPRLFVSGHKHVQWSLAWREQTLVSVGSLGIPKNGAPRPQYLWLEERAGAWHFEHRAFDYDFATTLRKYRESGFLRRGAPFSWLLYDEYRSGEDRIGRFFAQVAPRRQFLNGDEDWGREVRTLLETVGTWEALRREIDDSFA